MRLKSIVHSDLRKLKKLCKSISLIEFLCFSSGEPLLGSPLEKEYLLLVKEKDAIYAKYKDSITNLDPADRLIFTLYYLEGNTQQQIANKTNYCKSTITKKINSICKSLLEP